jgi:hypothetical protein
MYAFIICAASMSIRHSRAQDHVYTPDNFAQGTLQKRHITPLKTTSHKTPENPPHPLNGDDIETFFNNLLLGGAKAWNTVQANAYMFGFGAKLLSSWLSKKIVYTLSDSAKALLAQDPDKVTTASIIDREKISFAKGLMSSFKKAIQLYMDKSLRASASNEARSLINKGFDAGWDASHLVEFIAESREYLAKLDTPAAKKRLEELSRYALELQNTLSSVFSVATYPEIRSDLAYPIRTYHTTMLTCGPQDPYCLGYTQKPITINQVGDLLFNALSPLIQSVPTPAVGYAFAVISYYMAGIFVPFMMSKVLSMDPKKSDYQAIMYPLISKFLDKWMNVEVGSALGSLYIKLVKSISADEAGNPTADPKALEKELNDKLMLGLTARLVQTGAFPSHWGLFKNLVGWK